MYLENILKTPMTLLKPWLMDRHLKMTLVPHYSSLHPSRHIVVLYNGVKKTILVPAFSFNLCKFVQSFLQHTIPNVAVPYSLSASFICTP